jgi:hypothetical protein
MISVGIFPFQGGLISTLVSPEYHAGTGRPWSQVNVKKSLSLERTKAHVLKLVVEAMLADPDNAILLVQPHRVADYR